MKKKNLFIEHKGYIFDVEGDYFCIWKDGILLIRLCVAPVVEKKKHSISDWRKTDVGHLSGKVKGISASAHIKIDHGYVCFYFETKIKHFSGLHYFTDGCVNGDGWQTYLSDVNDCFHEIDIDAEVPISSCFNGLTPDKADGAGMTDPGDVPPTWIWNIPIRAFSLHTVFGWLGLSLPGPLPVGVTRLVMKDRKFSMLFEELRPSCKEGRMPKVYFLTGLTGAYDTLEVHRDLSKELGWIVERHSEHPEWWAWPTYKPCIDLDVDRQAKGHQDMFFYKNNQGEWVSLLTTQWLQEHLERWIKECRLQSGTRIHLDQAYMYGYGSDRIIKELGGAEGLRRLVDEWRNRNIYLGPYFHPFFVGANETFYKEHPECFCKPKDPSVKIQWCEMELSPAYIDWTHPEGRKRQLDYLEFLLSDKKGCLNCDWLGINNAEGPDPRYYEFYDPEWAIGDLLQYKVHRLIYQKVKQIKPDALVRRIGSAACYLQPFIDHVHLIENWISTTDEYYKRAHIFTRVTHQMLINTDPYYCSQSKGREFFMGMLVWNMPEFGGFTKAMHPYGYYRDLPLKDQRRRIAGLQVYLNAPQHRTDICRVTWDRDHPSEQWRKRTRGPLAGWYASLAIYPRCFVSYSETCARIGSSETRYANIPLPPGAKVKKVVRVLHEGGEKKIEYEDIGSEKEPMICLKVVDCGFETLYTEIQYQLKK